MKTLAPFSIDRRGKTCLRPRRGFTLMEVIVASGLVGVLFLVSIPLLSHARSVRQEASRRMIAVEQAGNLMEAVAALATSGNMTQQHLDELTLSPAARQLPEGMLSITLVDNAPPLWGTRVTLRIDWTTNAGARARAVSTTAWFPARGGE